MWKPGQIINVHSNIYRVTKSKTIKQSMTCMICAGVNTRPPCLDSNDYPETDKPFSVYECLTKIQKGCYLKKINVSSNI